jgi:hypothetical protein
VVIFFASTQYEAAALSQQMQNAFPAACVVGCSTAGEIAGGKMLTGSLVAMFLGPEVVVDAEAAVVANLASGTRVQEAFAGFQQRFQTPLSALDIREYVGVVLVDGMSRAEERVMEQIGICTDLFFVGGSAGDDLKFQKTYVCAAGEAHTDAAVLLVLKLKNGFEILKTQSFRPTGKRLTATLVREELRTVDQFDGQPALAAYAQAIGVSSTAAPGRFFRHPLALMVDGEPYLRSPQKAEGDSIVFHCQIKEGMEMEVLEATDIVADTRRAVEAAKSSIGKVAGVVDFQCILRTLELRDKNLCDEYAGIFSGLPTIGFSTYGEQYIGHMNQTSAILFFR